MGDPEDADEVIVNLEAKLENGTVVSKADGVGFTVEEGYFCPAISKAVKTMKKGEKVTPRIDNNVPNNSSCLGFN